MGEEGLGARVFDAGALIAIERGDARIRGTLTDSSRNVVPAPVLAQVWRDGAQQARLAKFLDAKGTIVEPLDELAARAAGVALGRSDTADVVDASVVVCARRYHALVLTADAADLLRIDPTLDVEEI